MTATLSRPLTATPERSYTQRLDALEKANDVRKRRARLKRDLKAGRKQLAPALLSPPEYILSMKVAELLLATPKLGPVKVGKALHRAKMSPSRTVGALSGSRRRELVGLVSR
jgi:hypothetical protein